MSPARTKEQEDDDALLKRYEKLTGETHFSALSQEEKRQRIKELERERQFREQFPKVPTAEPSKSTDDENQKSKGQPAVKMAGTVPENKSSKATAETIGESAAAQATSTPPKATPTPTPKATPAPKGDSDATRIARARAIARTITRAIARAKQQSKRGGQHSTEQNSNPKKSSRRDILGQSKNGAKLNSPKQMMKDFSKAYKYLDSDIAKTAFTLLVLILVARSLLTQNASEKQAKQSLQAGTSQANSPKGMTPKPK